MGREAYFGASYLKGSGLVPTKARLAAKRRLGCTPTSQLRGPRSAEYIAALMSGMRQCASPKFVQGRSEREIDTGGWLKDNCGAEVLETPT